MFLSQTCYDEILTRDTKIKVEIDRKRECQIENGGLLHRQLSQWYGQKMICWDMFSLKLVLQ